MGQLPAPMRERERRGVQRLHLEHLRREQGPRERELVVDLVGGAGVEHDPHLSLRFRQASFQPIAGNPGAGHRAVSVTGLLPATRSW